MYSKEHINLSKYTMADLKAMYDFAEKECNRFEQLFNRESERIGDRNARERFNKASRGYNLWKSICFAIEEEMYRRMENIFEIKPE